MEATENLETMVNSLLIVDQPEPEPQEVAPEPEVEAQEAEALEPEADEVEATEEAEAEEEETEQEQEPPKYTVKVDGKEIDVTLDDLKRSYSGQAYIQKGMQEAAEARKQAETLFNALQAEQAKFLQVVQSIQEQGFKAPPQAPDMAMMEKDPIGYMKAEAQYRKELGEFQAQQQETQRIAMLNKQMQERAMADFVQEQAQVLKSRIPEFADAKKAREVTGKIRSVAAEAYGFTEEEIGGVVDARHVQVLYDAMKWRELQAARTQKAPAPTKTIKPTAHRAEPPQLARKKQIDAARKSGKPDAFVDLLFN